MLLITIRLLILHILFDAIYSWGDGDPPGYKENYQKLMAIGERQSKEFITGAWKLPMEINSNPSIQAWLFDNVANTPNVMISWCGNKYSCKYIAFTTGAPNTEEWKDFKNWRLYHPIDSFEIFTAHGNGGAGRKPLLAGDIRLYRLENQLRMVFVTAEPGSKYMELGITDVFFDHSIDALYVLSPIKRINIDHEMGQRHQKNWSPFLYSYNHSHGTEELKTHIDNLFIYSITPHRIVYLEGDLDNNMVKANTASLTQFIHVEESRPLWAYGDPRGGTPALLINTKYGMRYITIFHSQCHCMIDWCLTYFMGAYIFEPEPPFAITHFSVEPIVPVPIYDENNGWAFKAIDYIAFPTGIIERNDTLIMSMGRNDNTGWIVLFNTQKLVNSLEAVKTETSKIENRYPPKHSD